MGKKGARKAVENAWQQQSFNEIIVESTLPSRPPALSIPHNEPRGAAHEAFSRLEGWLRDPTSGRPVYEVAEETPQSLAKALL